MKIFECLDKEEILYEVDDEVLSEYSAEKIEQIKLLRMHKFQESIETLGYVISFFASILGKKHHDFIVAEAEGMFVSVDYDDVGGGEVRIRLSKTLDGIMGKQAGLKRKNIKISQAVSTGSTWTKSVNSLNVYDLFVSVIKAKPDKPFHLLNNNCQIFAEKLWKILSQRQSKKKIQQ